MENEFIDREVLSAILLKYLQRILSVRYGEERKSIFDNVLQQKVLLEHLRLEKRKTDIEESEFKAFLDPKFEDEFFKLLFTEELEGTFYHYTSLEATFNILNTQKILMGSIAGMNDKSEMDFVDRLIGKSFLNPFNAKRIEVLNRRFIMCFSGIKDHFNQWRLYGNDGQGICLGFKYKKPSKQNFYIAIGRVVYGTQITDLIHALYNDIAKTCGCKFAFRRLFLWKNYLKHRDYEYENEIRLLVLNRVNKSHGFKMKKKFFKLNHYKILAPLVEFDLFDENLPIMLTEIILGPKVPEQKLNQAQLQYFLKYQNLKSIKVFLSSINHYR